MFSFLQKWFKKNHAPNRVLMIGGSGYVGRLILPLLAKDFSLTVFDLKRPPNGPWKYIYGDVQNPRAIQKALKGINTLLYLARGTKNQNINDVTSAYDVNLKGLHFTLEAAKQARIKRVVYTSTLSVYDGYGDLTTKALDKEELPPMVKSVYGLTKFFGEEICKFFYDRYQLPILVLRLFLPVSIEEWRAKLFEGSVDCRTVASDLARAVVSSLKSTHNEFEIIHITGDQTGCAYRHEKANKILGWQPQAQ